MAFEDLKNEIRKRAALFDEGGLPAALSGEISTTITVPVRRSVLDAAIALDRQHPGEDLMRILADHDQALRGKWYNREAQNFWRAISHFCHQVQLKVTSDGKTIIHTIEEDVGKGWPPFEKPCLLAPAVPATELATPADLRVQTQTAAFATPVQGDTRPVLPLELLSPPALAAAQRHQRKIDRSSNPNGPCDGRVIV